MAGYVHFSALNLYISLSENEHFFDDGEVEDLDGYLARTYRRYGKEKFEKLTPKAGGVCIPIYKLNPLINCSFPPIKVHKEKFVHIAYRKSKNPVDEYRLRGHEEAHALRYLGKLKWLFAKIGRKYGINEMVRVMVKYLAKRVINLPRKRFQYDGYIGSALALCEHGLLREVITGRPATFSKALELIEAIYKR